MINIGTSLRSQRLLQTGHPSRRQVPHMTHIHLQRCQALQQPFTIHRLHTPPGRCAAGPDIFHSSCAVRRSPSIRSTPAGLKHSTRRHAPKNLQAAEVLYELADVDAKTASTIASLLGPVLSVGQLLMIVRIVLSWYPNINYGKLPWVLAVRPTEPILKPTRKVIPIVGGLDVTPVVWVALLSFINEILLGPQGILNLLQRKADL